MDLCSVFGVRCSARKKEPRQGIVAGALVLTGGLADSAAAQVPTSLLANLGRIAVSGGATRAQPIGQSSTAANTSGAWSLSAGVVFYGLVATVLLGLAIYAVVWVTDDADLVALPGGESRIDTLADDESAHDAGETVRPVPAAATNVDVLVVWDSSGAPVAGATATLLRSETDADGLTVACDAEGRATLPIAGFNGPAWLRVELGKAIRTQKRVVLSTAREISVRVPESYVITGLVKEELSGKVVVDAEIDAGCHGETAKAVTDANGVYQLRLPKMGRVSLAAWSPHTVVGYSTVNLTEPGVAQLDFQLATTVDGRIKVVDEDGAPIAGVDVTPFQTNAVYYWGSDDRNTQTTDAEGLAWVQLHSGLLRGSPRLSIEKKGYDTVSQTPLTKNEADEWCVTVVLTRVIAKTHVVEGYVFDPSGKPVEGGSIGWNDRWSKTLSDKNGFYRLTFVDSREDFALVAYAPGWARNLKQAFTPGTPETPARLDFTLEPAHWLRGQVVDTENTPIAEVEVVAERRGELKPRGDSHKAKTDAGGWFFLRDLAAPRVDLKINGRGWSSAYLTGVAVDQEIRHTLLLPGSVRGHVVDDETGQPIRNFSVAILEWRQPHWYSSSTGEFIVGELPRGREKLYDVRVTANGYVPTRLAQVPALPPGETAVNIIRLSRSHELSGVVLDGENGSPLSGIVVKVGVLERETSLWEDWSRGRYVHHVQSANTDDSGEFRFEEDAEGTLIVRVPGYRRVAIRPQGRDQYEDENGLLAIALMPAETISGVTLEKGQP